MAALIDAVGVADDVAGVVLAEDLIKAGDVSDAAIDDIAQHIAGAHRWQLIDIADEEKVGCRLQRFEQAVEELQVEHGGFVDDDQVGRQRVGFVVFEAALIGRETEQTVDGAGAFAGGFGQAFGRASGRRCQLKARIALLQRVDQHLQGRGFAGAGSAGEDADLARQRRAHRIELLWRKRHIVAFAQL